MLSWSMATPSDPAGVMYREEEEEEECIWNVKRHKTVTNKACPTRCRVEETRENLFSRITSFSPWRANFISW